MYVIIRRTDILLLYHLSHPVYILQVELIIHWNIWIVIYVVKTAIICQNVVVMIYIYMNVCGCVWERGERERESKSKRGWFNK